ncbi:succinate--hydroxymethylglutarate CoA-transferase [Eurytemora carolleeae]|uniref:succinate--hydroxymethylglutarate CoA-transferase n=1 Tax=Eurytemora carolleeae TaxID=1294199 RepID=UPI000C768D43|nr:succinate--hydroxymethylglutarate CoA-transferase [Eurytemora carolleeae]|eukprot:XP_023325120.1 succinate--hydroxymethylglutarate CoA-transferase-like [Eurytemora affinis]
MFERGFSSGADLSPLKGVRSWGPPFLSSGSGSDVSGRESTYFLSVNRNKKSICVDMNTEEGRTILTELAGVSDVLVENYIPGTLDKKGLGYTQLKETAPGLIYCSITGFGSSGPYKNRGGYDVIAASLGGLSHVTGEKDGGPMKVGVAMTDLATSLYAHGAILAALYQKEKTGLGQKIDCNLLSTQVSAMVNLAGTYLNTGQIPGRWGTAHASIVPYQTFKTADGYFTIGCGNNSQFREFSERIDRTDLPDHLAFKTNEDRVQNREKLVSILSEILGEYGNEHWNIQFEGSSFPYSPVNNLEQVFNNPQVQHNNLCQTVQHSTLGEIHQVGPAVQYSLAENRIRTAPPVLGEHTDAVLTDILGYSVQTIQSYRKKGVIT